MIVFDYLCFTLDENYDRAFLDSRAEAGNPYAIHAKIRLGEIEGEDSAVDVYAAAYAGREEMVEEGLKLLVRKKDSSKAEAHLAKIEETKKLKSSVRGTFVKAMEGDAGSVAKLAELAGMFPEAELMRGYLEAPAEERERYLKDRLRGNRDTIVSISSDLGISDTAFGKYLAAKKLQVSGEEWVQSMIGAVKAGSEEAMDELRPIENRKDVRKSLASIYLANGDAEKLARSYDGIDSYWLEQYCGEDPEKFLEIGRILGGVREIDWLKKGFLLGHAECRDALIVISGSEERRCKQLVYVLHDVGADLDAARLYFTMAGDPSLPAVKWLKKVCRDGETKEFIRSHYEDLGDTETFDYIFEEDGYSYPKKNAGRGNRNGKYRR